MKDNSSILMVKRKVRQRVRSALPCTSTWLKSSSSIVGVDKKDSWDDNTRQNNHVVLNQGGNGNGSEDDVKNEDVIFDTMLQFSEQTTPTFTTNKRRRTDNNDDGETMHDDGGNTNTSKNDDNNSERQQQQNTLTDNVDCLLGYIMQQQHHHQQHNSLSTADTTAMNTTTSSFVSSNDIVCLLLPWALRSILKDASNKNKTSPSLSSKILHWITLNECLSYVFGYSKEENEQRQHDNDDDENENDDDNNVLGGIAEKSQRIDYKIATATRPTTREKNHNFKGVNSVLTLSTLHKIVPIALRLALEATTATATATAISTSHHPTKCSAPKTMQTLASNCYCLLCDNLYRPPFDVLCETLLPVLVREHNNRLSQDKDANGNNNSKNDDDDIDVDIDNDIDNDVDNATTAIWLRVTTCTIGLMNLKISHANPKKSFQLLVRPTVFLHLSDLYSKIVQIEKEKPKKEKSLNLLKVAFHALIREGIFSLEHHMNGFRSMQLVPDHNKGGSQKQKNVGKDATTGASSTQSLTSFRCYQELLLATIENYLSIESSTSSEERSQLVSIEFISRITPLLLGTFFEQILEMQQVSQHQYMTIKKFHHRKSKDSDKIGYQQFRFFSYITGTVLKGLLKCKRNGDYELLHPHMYDRVIVSLLSTLEINLELLLKYNVYQPSISNNVEKLFLNKIGNDTIQFIIACEWNDNSNGAQQHNGHGSVPVAEWECSIRILDVLLRLNHTILHDRLTEIFAKYLTHDPKHESNGGAAAVVVVSKEALKFFGTIITTYGKLRQLDYFYKSMFDAISMLCRESECTKLRRLLAFASDNEFSKHVSRSIQESPLQQLQQIFSTANESFSTRRFCDDKIYTHSSEANLIANSVRTKLLQDLLRNVRIDSNSSRYINPICEKVISDPITSLIELDNARDLNNAVTLYAWTLNLKNRCEFWLPDHHALLILPSIHRVLKLRIAANCKNDNNRDDQDDDELLQSLKFLACQRIQQLHGQLYDKQRLAYASDAEQYDTSSETLEARELVGFMLQGFYSNGQESDSKKQQMWDQWVALAKSISTWSPYADEIDVNFFLRQLLKGIAITENSSDYRRNDILSLLNDSNFYEIPNVANRLPTNVISFVAENVQKILQLCNGPTPKTYEVSRPILDPDWKNFSFAEILNVQKSPIQISCASNHLVKVDEYLEDSLRVLERINNVCIPIWEQSNDALKIFESFVRIEIICCMLLTKNDICCVDSIAQLISELRFAASRTLANASSQMNGKSPDTKKGDSLILLRLILNSSSVCLNNDPSSHVTHRFINSCTAMFSLLMDVCMESDKDSIMKMIQILELSFHQNEIEVNGTNYLILIGYAVTLQKKFLRTKDADVSNIAIDLFFGVIVQRLGVQILNYCFDDSKEANLLFRKLSRMFVAEAFCLSSKRYNIRFPLVCSVENETVIKLRNFTTWEHDDFEVRSLSYLVGCYALTKPSTNTRHKLTNELLTTSLRGCSVFITPLCILAKCMIPDEFEKFLDKLISATVAIPTTTIKLKIIHTLVLSMTDQDKLEIVAKYSAAIMSNCLQVMAQVATQVDVEFDSIVVVSELIVDMASRNSIMILRERDIALIMACISSTIVNEEEDTNKRTKNEDQIKSYDSCFLLVSFFLQRFSKQMHSCVPSLITALTKMLEYSLLGTIPVASSFGCGQKFSRLCELLLPYGEVYKKHVICLIIRFVDVLQGSMDVVRKKSILPGIYCLLDIIQDHECKQLNSMLDEVGRALFRSIHEGYKSKHVYHGQ